MRRFYLLTVQRDLFGGATLVREWGRIRKQQYADEGLALDALANAAKSKRRRGYRDRQGLMCCSIAASDDAR